MKVDNSLRFVILAAAVVMLASCGPPVHVEYGESGTVVRVESYGEYPTKVGRIRITDANGGIVLDLENYEKPPSLWRFLLKEGRNPIPLSLFPDWSDYEVRFPVDQDHFYLSQEVIYDIQICGTNNDDCTEVSFFIR